MILYEDYFELTAFAKMLTAQMCDNKLRICVDDHSAWHTYPKNRWMFNKLEASASFGVESAPHGIEPTSYPVVSKPIYNLYGMGKGAKFVESEHDFVYQAGHMWSEWLTGEHTSIDVVIMYDKPTYFIHSKGYALDLQTFDYWSVNNHRNEEIENIITQWCSGNINDMKFGILNFEFVGSKCIEVHLRVSMQFCDIYGMKFFQSLEPMTKDFTDVSSPGSGYSVPIFSDSRKLIFPEIYTLPSSIISIDTVIEEVSNNLFRIAVINSTDLDDALEIRDLLTA